MKYTKKQILSIFMALSILSGTMVYADYAAPVAENLELTTYRNVSIGGRMTANVPKGSTVEYIVTTEPVKGTLDISQDGHFIYTPKENKKGQDYFGYKAVDENGTESQEATVIIHILRKAPTIRYSDTEGLACDYAASALAENEIFTGVQVGGDYYFRPNEEVSQQEFIAMCRAIYKDISNECVLPVSENNTLDYCDAAIILNEIAHFSPVPCLSAETMAGVDEKSIQAVSNLQACGVLPVYSVPLSEPLRRGEAANMLLRAAAVLEAR